MFKLPGLILFVVLPLASSFPQNFMYRPTVISTDQNRSTYTWDNFGNKTSLTYETLRDNEYKLNYRIIYINNNKGLETEEIYETWQNSEWIASGKITKTYSSFGQILSKSSEDQRFTYIYNSSGLLTEYLWDEKSTSGVFVNCYRLYYTYNKSGLCTSQLHQSYGSNSKLKTYTYSDDGYLLVDEEDHWNGNSWNNYNRYNHSYDPSGNRVTSIYQTNYDNIWTNVKFDSIAYNNKRQPIYHLMKTWNSQWIDILLETTEYSRTGKVTMLLTQGKTETGWVDAEKRIYTYNLYDDVLTDLHEYYSSDSISTTIKKIYNYDMFGNAVHGELLLQGFGPSINDCILNCFYNHCQDTLKFGLTYHFDAAYAKFKYININLPQVFDLEQNYPNPFNPTTTITYRLLNGGNVRLTVYDAIGGKAAELVNEYKPAGTYSEHFNGANLSSGPYFYTLECNGNSTTKKLLLLK